ncbi:hypothetical protein CCMA1212_009398 [Trichoderma ghanense]|uniref:Uncharacterized protein n=1 Tax=Trichoderma ghanense TaxID=65468 RepID=A0ABY2GT94_9HYPO
MPGTSIRSKAEDEAGPGRAAIAHESAAGRNKPAVKEGPQLEIPPEQMRHCRKAAAQGGRGVWAEVVVERRPQEMGVRSLGRLRSRFANEAGTVTPVKFPDFEQNWAPWSPKPIALGGVSMFFRGASRGTPLIYGVNLSLSYR